MNTPIRNLTVMFMAGFAAALSPSSSTVVGPLAVATAITAAAVTSDTAEARRGGGRAHHGGHHKRRPRPDHNGGNHHHHHDWDYDHRHHDHYGRWVAGAAVAGAVAGAVYYSVPCGKTVVRNGNTYYYCGGVYYRPRYSGSDVTYVVVNF
jgi:hypothetical protein